MDDIYARLGVASGIEQTSSTERSQPGGQRLDGLILDIIGGQRRIVAIMQRNKGTSGDFPRSSS